WAAGGPAPRAWVGPHRSNLGAAAADVRALSGSGKARTSSRAPAGWQPRDRQRKLPRPMPELPEVETTRRGLAPLVVGRQIAGFDVRETRLRWPVPAQLDRLLAGRRIESVSRRAKYLLFGTDAGTLLVHLGMSGG